MAGLRRSHCATIGLCLTLVTCCQYKATAQSLIRNGSFEQAGELVDGYLPGVIDHNTGNQPRFESDPPTAGEIYVLNDGSTAINDWRAFVRTSGATIDWVHENAVSAPHGTLSVDLNGTPGPGGIWQEFRTIPGFEYIVTFDMASNPAVLGLEQMGVGTVREYATMLNVGVQATPQDPTAFEYSPTSSMSFSHSISGETHSTSNPGWETKQWTFTATDVQSAIVFESHTPAFNRDVTGLPPEEQIAAKLLDFGPMVDNVSVRFVGEFLHWVPLTGGMAGDCCLASDAWNVANNWTDSPLGGARNRVPGPEDVVLIDASMFATTEAESYTAVLNTNAVVKKLIVASPQDAIEVFGSRSLEVVDGTLQNYGRIIFNDDADLILRGVLHPGGSHHLVMGNHGEIILNQSSTGSSDLQIDGTVTLLGEGSLNLAGGAWAGTSSDRIIGVQTDGTSILHNGSGHTVRGDGEFGVDRLGIINHGLIVGDGNETLVIDPDATNGLVNLGVLAASGGGRLSLAKGTFDSSGGGTIHAANDSIVLFSTDARILGGTITTEGTGRVGVPDDGQPILAGAITIYGIVVLNQTSTGNSSMWIDGPVTLSGIGHLQLIGSDNDRIIGLQTDGISVLTNGVDHTISGDGQLGVNRLGIINYGTIDGSGNGILTIDPDGTTGLVNLGTLTATKGGRLSLADGTFDSTGGGVIHAADNSTVLLATNGRILGGTITAEGTGLVRVPDDGQPIFAGAITNNSRIVVNQLSTGNSSVHIDGHVIIDGSGEIQLGSSFDRIIPLSNGKLSLLTNGTNHSILGNGSIQVNVNNNGTLMGESPALRASLSGHVSGIGLLGNVTISGTHEPGDGTAIVPLTGQYSLTGSARLKMEIGGLNPGTEHDQLASDGTIALSGVLNIDPFFADGVPYLPAIDDIFTIITADGGITGTFSNSANVITNFVGYHVKWNVLYGSNSVDVQVASISGFGIPGDFDLDGDVDSDDLDNWRMAYNATGMGDANGDGSTDGRDFLVWQRKYNSGAASTTAMTGTTAVPEPTTAVLVCAALLALVGRGYRQ